jgi:hypothetical protein
VIACLIAGVGGDTRGVEDAYSKMLGPVAEFGL